LGLSHIALFGALDNGRPLVRIDLRMCRIPPTDNVAFAKAMMLGILDADSGKMRLMKPDKRHACGELRGSWEVEEVWSSPHGGTQSEKYGIPQFSLNPSSTAPSRMQPLLPRQIISLHELDEMRIAICSVLDCAAA
jgi:hypothetical protein